MSVAIFEINAAGDIAYARIQASNTPPAPGTLMAAENGSTFPYGSSVLYTYDNGGGGGTDFSMQESFYRWDTSSLAGWALDSAVLRVKVFMNPSLVGLSGNIGSRWITGNAGQDRWNGGTPPILGDVAYARPGLQQVFTKTYGGVDWIGDAWVDIPITDLSGINQSGYTRLGLSVAENYAGVGVTDTQQFVVYGWDGDGDDAPKLIVNGTPPSGQCHTTQPDVAPSVTQCPLTATLSECDVRCEVRALDGTQPPLVWWRAEMLEPSALRTSGGLIRSGFTLRAQDRQQDATAAQIACPPQSALCPHSVSVLQSDLRVEFRALGVRVWAEVPDSATARLEEIVGLAAPSGAVNDLCTVSLDFGAENAHKPVMFSLSGVARWQGGGGALIGTAPVIVRLDENGQGEIDLPPADALTAGVSVNAWIARAVNMWFTVPDASSCNMDDLVSV
jgi:hypothetical protein